MIRSTEDVAALHRATSGLIDASDVEHVQVVSDRNTHIVLGRIVHAHVEPSVWKDGRVDPRLLDPICRLSGSGYAALGELVNVQRPKWKDVAGTTGQQAMPRAVTR